MQDPMHVLLEGVVPLELSHILFHYVYIRRYFSLKWLNSAIAGYRYSYLLKSAKPEMIDKCHIDGKGGLKQTAASMLTLCEILPFIIAEKVPVGDEHWLNTVRLLQIVLVCTSPICTRQTASALRILVAQYLTAFKRLYPKTSFTPKMHYMIHFPQQMLLYGPLRHHWCMRFEGKNCLLGNVRYKNFKNIAFTVPKRHQLQMAFHQTSQTGGRSSETVHYQ